MDYLTATLHLAEEVGAALAARLGQPAPSTVDVAALGERLLRPGAVDVAAALRLLGRASLLVVATPACRGSYAGVLKVLLDALPADGLRNVAAVPVLTAGGAAEAAAAELKLRDLLTELGAEPVTPALAVVEKDLVQLRAVAARYAEQLVLDLAVEVTTPAVLV
jgi:FMN reductase